jgi:hypothetical protein
MPGEQENPVPSIQMKVFAEIEIIFDNKRMLLM